MGVPVQRCQRWFIEVVIVAMGYQNMLRLGHIPMIKSQGGKIFYEPEYFRKHRIHQHIAVYVFDNHTGMFQKCY